MHSFQRYWYPKSRLYQQAAKYHWHHKFRFLQEWDTDKFHCLGRNIHPNHQRLEQV